MSSLFSVLTQLSSSINDAVMGERLRLTPRTGAVGMSAGGVDETRPTLDEIVGIYKEVVERTRTADAAAGRDFERRFMTPKITISVRRELLGDNEYRKGDRFARLDQSGEPELEISAADPIDDGRIAFTVVVVS